MSKFEVDYSWQERHYGTTEVDANDVLDAEKKAFEVLSATFEDQEDDADVEQTLFIESIREITKGNQELKN